ASNALPPCSSTAIPAAEASQCVEATMPNVPASSGLVVNPGVSAMTRSSHLAPSGPAQCAGRRRSVPARESRAPRPDSVSRMDLSPRVRAVCDLDVSEAREFAGRHEYDGKPQDLSPAGVRAGLARLEEARSGSGPLPDPHDEAHLSAAEGLKRVTFARLELHRKNPLFHLGELDLSCYDRDYAPQQERDAARAAHLAAWRPGSPRERATVPGRRPWPRPGPRTHGWSRTSNARRRRATPTRRSAGRRSPP